MENIQVVLRVRPQNHLEVENNDKEVWQVQNSSAISVNPDIHADLIKAKKIGFGHKTDFSFNHCFDKYNTNINVYESQVKRIALSSLQGINGTVFMYGQTGSGKTFTMVGPHKHHPPVFSSHGNHSEFISARGQSNYDFGFATNKTPRTLPTLENERPYENSLGNNSRTFFNRSKSPITAQEKNRRLSDKSPLKITRNMKSPERAETPLSTKIDLDPQQTKSSENFNSSLAHLINSHKRSSTLQYPHGQSTHSQTVVSPQRMDIRACEMDKLKSHPGNSEGVLMLAMKDIFDEIERQPQKKFFLRCSYLEIYTDLVYDLLNSQDKLSEVLTINEDINKEFYIKGATEEIVSSLDEILQKIRKGEANRHYASTAMNHSSSRSHTIFRLYVQSLPAHVDNDQGHYMTESLLNFVDLAGSEKVDIHDSMRYNRREPSTGGSLSPLSSTPTSHKERVRENQHINKSLFFLTQVISLKSQGKQDLFIPYRNSPLTKILRSSLGGNSRTAIILCVNPSISQFEQTMSTLRFGLNAKKIENQVHANIICDAGDEMLRNLLREYEKKIFDMEIEKNKDKSTSEQLLKIIHNLEEQKKLLSERLRNVKKTFPNQLADLTHLSSKHHKAEDLHYNDVGILHVLVSRENKDKKADYDFEGKYALQSLKSVKEQNAILAEKLKKMTEKLEENEREKYELLEALANKDKRLSKKKNAIKHFADKLNEYHVKNDRLRQIVDLYQNKNPEGMKRLPMETLCKLEASQLSLLDSIKLQKALKIVCQSLPREMGDTESYRLFKNFLYDITEKDKNVKAHISFGDEIDFDVDFFNPTPLHHTSSKRTKLLNEMQKDPNIRCSVGGSMDEGLNSDDSLEERSLSPDDKEPDSFQHYFSSVDKSVRNDGGQTDRQAGEIDAKLNKLRNSYNKIIELIKKDNLDQLLGQPEAPTIVEYGYRNLNKVSNGAFVGRAPSSSPKARMEKGEIDYSSAKNLSRDLKDTTNIMNAMGSVESHEIGNSKMMGILNAFEEKSQVARGREKKKISQKENIRVENINLEVEPKKPSPLPYSYETGLPSYRTKYACVNL